MGANLVDLALPTVPLDRCFQQGVGSCHAYLTLREDFRQHVRLVQQEIGFRGIRFHGIFNDQVGAMRYRVAPGETPYNFQNITRIYEFFVAQGMKPFVELSFMPAALASGSQTIFAYRANVTPPKDWAAWNGLVTSFVRHLVAYFGAEEVRTWRFEVWNEPDLMPHFWTGSQADYFRLYAETARAIKAVDPRLRVGGPATSKSLWIPEFLAFCGEQRLPVDFVSTHHYGVDAALVEGVPTRELRWRGAQAMRDDAQRVRSAIAASSFPQAELHFTEWNASPAHEDRFGKDSEFTAVFALQTIKDVSGLVDSYQWWTLSDIFEESGLGFLPFTGKYGLVNMHGIKKPVFHAFRWLARLFDDEVPLAAPSLRVTRNARGEVRLLTWNLPEVLATDLGGGDWTISGEPRPEQIVLTGIGGRHRIRAWRVDRTLGNALRAWQQLGAPAYPDRAQLDELAHAGEAVEVCDRVVDCDGSCRLEHTLSPCAVVYYELTRV